VRYEKRIICLFGLIIFACGLIFVQGCSQSANPKFQSEYQAILLTTGQVFFGKVEFLGKEYVQVKNVFYIRSLVNQETKEVSNTLIKKGNELTRSGSDVHQYPPHYHDGTGFSGISVRQED